MPQPGSSEPMRKAQVQGQRCRTARSGCVSSVSNRGENMQKQEYRVRHKKAPAAAATQTGTLVKTRMGAPTARVLTLAKKSPGCDRKTRAAGCCQHVPVGTTHEAPSGHRNFPRLGGGCART